MSVLPRAFAASVMDRLARGSVLPACASLQVPALLRHDGASAGFVRATESSGAVEICGRNSVRVRIRRTETQQTPRATKHKETCQLSTATAGTTGHTDDAAGNEAARNDREGPSTPGSAIDQITRNTAQLRGKPNAPIGTDHSRRARAHESDAIDDSVRVRSGARLRPRTLVRVGRLRDRSVVIGGFGLTLSRTHTRLVNRRSFA